MESEVRPKSSAKTV